MKEVNGISSYSSPFVTFANVQNRKDNLLLLVQRILLLVGFYSLCRFFFLAFNFSYFTEVPAVSLLKDFFFGLRFDLSAIIISNILFISLHFIPFRFFYSRAYQLILEILFLIVNIPFLLFSSIDFGLFRFSAKHATSEAFKVMSFGEDFVNTLPEMIRDFWYVLLVFIIISILLVWCYNKIGLIKKTADKKISFQLVVKKISIYLISVGLVIIGFRGGIQYKPISIISASHYGSSKDVALILNTPFTILKTFYKSALSEVNYFSKEESEKIFPVNHRFHHAGPQRNINVVLIILESFGKEYIGSLNHYRGYTPFLDSLIGESLVFTNAFANGKRSIEGIPSITAGIPSLMEEPFITSAYSGNSINSLASLLKRKGYATSFYHGGTNGTMGFDNFTTLAGFDSYYGRREYNNDKDFDGSWGIYDEPFLQNFAHDLNTMTSPFYAAVFTLSSHHPYAIPEIYKDKFRDGTLPIHRSIQYTDYSLKKFFESASKMPFFDNTLFVITADHTALSEYPFYQNKVGMYSIPVIFYQHNSALKGRSDLTTQQIDIMPSVLDYVDFDEPFFSFGESVFDSTADHFAVNFLNDNYQLLSANYSLSLDTMKNNFLFHYTTDSLLQNNLVATDTALAAKMEKKLKAIIQNYNSALIKNKMIVNPQSTLNSKR
jgi:phosphoglycerol transferase MdoB-like AlkP superfamily enzyme